MGRPIRCRTCGALFTPEPFDVVARWGRRCPRCRGLLPPTGGEFAGDGPPRVAVRLLSEVAP
jgi:hypothetical protein